ncbi:MAG: Glyoxalase/bleomycin resistance protein/dioxygenase [Frankiales bacterium]|nr:Glyoxalase/bleomycin resistance protein/dioxygenase [Frankiales bacterium]
MPVRDDRWPAGTPNGVDLSTPDPDAAKDFYAALLGWDYREAGGGYWLCEYGSREAAGIMGAESPEQPSSWTVYFASEDVESTVKAVEQAGGQVLPGPAKVAPWGAVAYAADPTGARFGVWQGGVLPGVTVYNEPGSLTWEDGMVSDPDAAKSFYSSAFGFRFDPVPGDQDYCTFTTSSAGDPLGGLGSVEEASSPAGGRASPSPTPTWPSRPRPGSGAGSWRPRSIPRTGGWPASPTRSAPG